MLDARGPAAALLDGVIVAAKVATAEGPGWLGWAGFWARDAPVILQLFQV
jgi:hypothetical protein